MDRVNYQHLIFLTLILTTIITSIDDVFRIVAARVIKVNAVESLEILKYLKFRRDVCKIDIEFSRRKVT